MRLRGFAQLFALAGLLTCWTALVLPVQAQQGRGVQWIWFNEGDPLKQAPAEPRYFRKTFDVGRPVDEAFLDVAADKEFTCWVNGAQVGNGKDPKRVYWYDIKKHVVVGKNVIAVEAKGSGGPSAMLARLSFVPNGQSVVGMGSDGSWKSSKSADNGWQKAEFDDSKWAAAKVLGAYGKTGPWKGMVWDAGGDDRFSVPPGFRVEQVIPGTPSLVNLCFDDKGRLLVSQENGPILLCTKPDKDGLMQSVEPYCDKVKNCQGMCWVNDALLLVGTGPQSTGLYRVRDTKGVDTIDQVEVLHQFRGGMGEHGPHAIIHGPDNWLYCVIGNHAWANVKNLADNSPLRRWPTGAMGPDQGKPGTTEDVLLPRQNDSSGHAANILAPGGTIWRLDQQGNNMALVAAGFRNHFDAAFNSNGELVTFDSDMEWDEGLPWYRAVRVCHCPPGADYVWRTGAANPPDYHLDSLAPLYETGRGSPVGVEFYEHHAYPEKYRGAYFMADWSIGVIWVVHLKRDGATYRGKAERFCTGVPLNVTDVVVGPDGALYFTMGGRGSQGGVYRIVYGTGAAPATPTAGDQPLSAWGRSLIQKQLDEQIKKEGKDTVDKLLTFLKLGPSTLTPLTMLNVRQNHGMPADPVLLATLAKSKDVDLRAHAIYQLGINSYKEGEAVLVQALKDDDALVRRRAGEALVRAGFEPPVEALWPLLAEQDRFVRTAARLVLQRIDPKKWADHIAKTTNDLVAWECIIALCKINQARPYAESIFARLNKTVAAEPQAQLDQLRTIQMALIHGGAAPPAAKEIGARCLALFPQKDWRVNRELAVVLAHLARDGTLDKPVHAALLKDLLANTDDRQQQMHYFYCLRLLHQDWTVEQKDALLAWFDATKTWTGGHSFRGFLDNILRDAGPVFTADDRKRVLAKADQMPRAASVLLKLAAPSERPSPAALSALFEKLTQSKPASGTNELKAFIIDGLVAQSGEPEAQIALRNIADKDTTQRDPVARALLKTPTAENWPYLVRGLNTGDGFLLPQLVDTLKRAPTKPKIDEPAPFRAALLASERLNEKQRWKAVELLRHWSNRSFGAEKPEDWRQELSSFAKWFGQSFPKEPPLPNLTADKPAESKWKFDELLTYLEKDPEGTKGNALRGRAVFEKAQCLKCHKYGKEGEGLGPDLTAVSKRFKRFDILESTIYPSKVISDQYRSVVIVTKQGQQLMGLAAPQGDLVTVLLSDGSKVMLKKDDIEQQIASLVSVMPEKLLDMLTKQEIADLFAFMESEPAK